MKIYALGTDYEKEEPTFTNDKGKFWLVDRQDPYWIFRCHLNNGDKSYVLAYKGEFIADNASLEGIGAKIDIHRICLSRMKSNQK